MRRFVKVHTSRGTDFAGRVFEVLSTHANGTEYNLRDVNGGRGSFRMFVDHTYTDHETLKRTVAANKKEG